MGDSPSSGLWGTSYRFWQWFAALAMGLLGRMGACWVCQGVVWGFFGWCLLSLPWVCSVVWVPAGFAFPYSHHSPASPPRIGVKGSPNPSLGSQKQILGGRSLAHQVLECRVPVPSTKSFLNPFPQPLGFTLPPAPKGGGPEDAL